jgi:hypothetical protein
VLSFFTCGATCVDGTTVNEQQATTELRVVHTTPHLLHVVLDLLPEVSALYTHRAHLLLQGFDAVGGAAQVCLQARRLRDKQRHDKHRDGTSSAHSSREDNDNTSARAGGDATA